MSALPRVEASMREQVAREFDDLGPDACIAEISEDLREHNPEWLHMAARCAMDLGDERRVMGGFCMFYRSLIAQALPGHPLSTASDVAMRINPLPRVTEITRAALVAEIDQRGTEAFIRDAIQQMEEGNPELLQMAHNFASGHENYAGVVQGFALLYAALLKQSAADRLSVH
jgi:hypothetical protein